MDKRYGRVKWGKGNPRSRTAPSNWKKVRSWNNHAGRNGIRPRVFCASLSDWLDSEVPIEWLVDLLDLVRTTPHLDWLLLTKRPENWYGRIHAALAHAEGIKDLDGWEGFTETDLGNWLNDWTRTDSEGIPTNIWIGTTVENQEYADKRIPELLKIPARVRFLSCEPMVGPVNLTISGGLALAGLDGKTNIDWVIVGGESGPGARAMPEQWAGSLRTQCEAAGVAFWMKQMGGSPNSRHQFADIPEDLRVRELPVPV